MDSEKIVYIDNSNAKFHYEILETLICKYDSIIKKNKCENDIIYLSFMKNDSFEKYIRSKYPKIIVNIKPEVCDYIIYPTHYDIKNFQFSQKYFDDAKHYYISHNITAFTKNAHNIYHLTPLCKSNNYIFADVLPYSNEKKYSAIPIYIIQGNIEDKRRNYKLLEKILEKQYDYDYRIKVIGYGKLNSNFDKYSDKIIGKYGLNYIDFHKEFLDGYCILPLTLKETQPQYYTDKLTSSISYGLAYNLKFLIDKELQDCYNLKNVEVFNNVDNITIAFEKTLVDFYNNRQR